MPASRLVVLVSTVAAMCATLVASPPGAVSATVAAPPVWQVSDLVGGTVSVTATTAGDRTLIGTRGGGIFTSDHGGRWVRRLFPMDPVDTRPGTGWVMDVDAVPGSPVVYATVSGEGVYRSDDAGTTWTRLRYVPGVFGVASPANNRQRVYLALTSELWRSSNGGATWRPVTDGFGQNVPAVRVDVSPSAPSRVWALGNTTLHRSTDGGTTWTGISPGGGGPFEALAVDPTDPATAYVGGLSPEVHATHDAGASWSSARLPAGASWVSSLAVDPTEPDTVLAGDIALPRVYRSVDSGASWGMQTLPGAQHGVASVGVDPAGDAWAGAEYQGPFRSRDGVTWQRRVTGLYAARVDRVHVLPGRPDVVLAGTAGDGIHRSTDGGLTFRRILLGGLSVTGFDSHAGAPDVVLAATSRGVYRSTDAGATWARRTSRGANDVAISPSNHNRVLAAAGSQLLRSTDAGLTWSVVPTVRGWEFRSVAFDPGVASRAYAGTNSEGVVSSTDGGLTWTQAQSGATQRSAVQLAVHPAAPGRIFAAGDYGLYRSLSRGDDGTWSGVAGGPPLGTGVAIDPRDAATVYWSSGGDHLQPRVARSTDGGATWSSFAADLPTRYADAVEVAPDGTVFVGTGSTGYGGGAGLFRRTP